MNHKEIVAAQGVKVCGKDLERALAGTQVLVAEHPDEVEILKVMSSCSCAGSETLTCGIAGGAGSYDEEGIEVHHVVRERCVCTSIHFGVS